jgi:hypothetical protein
MLPPGGAGQNTSRYWPPGNAGKAEASPGRAKPKRIAALRQIAGRCPPSPKERFSS